MIKYIATVLLRPQYERTEVLISHHELVRVILTQQNLAVRFRKVCITGGNYNMIKNPCIKTVAIIESVLKWWSCRYTDTWLLNQEQSLAQGST